MSDQGRSDSVGAPDRVPQSRKGRLKVYLGGAAGVGKTYRMLEEAHQLRDQGHDVVIGFVETHGRAETAARDKQTKGPAGYREVGCGTVSFYSEDGEMLRAVRIVSPQSDPSVRTTEVMSLWLRDGRGQREAGGQTTEHGRA